MPVEQATHDSNRQIYKDTIIKGEDIKDGDKLFVHGSLLIDGDVHAKDVTIIQHSSDRESKLGLVIAGDVRGKADDGAPAIHILAEGSTGSPVRILGSAENVKIENPSGDVHIERDASHADIRGKSVKAQRMEDSTVAFSDHLSVEWSVGGVTAQSSSPFPAYSIQVGGAVTDSTLAASQVTIRAHDRTDAVDNTLISAGRVSIEGHVKRSTFKADDVTLASHDDKTRFERTERPFAEDPKVTVTNPATKKWTDKIADRLGTDRSGGRDR